jgi:hypothetical protein
MPEAARLAYACAWVEFIASERVAAERPEAYRNIAGLLDQSGGATGALAALALEPVYPPALVNMAEFESRRGRALRAWPRPCPRRQRRFGNALSRLSCGTGSGRAALQLCVHHCSQKPRAARAGMADAA